ncbi:MAG: glycosyltransferase family 4 protein [Lentisphaeria bacterium]|jgi:glycosyltransferase involved in cell wall biosynthesis|nr:glycosyltransferase family 4 protein [Lentisphaeria bacterium]
MSEPMRICHIITRMIVGGAQENTLLTCRDHLEKGHQVVLVTGPTAGPEGKLLQKQPLPGLEIVEIPDLVRELAPLADWRACRDLRKLFRERRFDVVHTHSSKAGIVGRIAAWKERVPVVVHTVHGQAFHPYQAAWRNQLYILAERYAARRCHRIYAVAQAMIDQCVAARVAPPEKYQVVYSGMDMAAFANARPEPALRAALGLPEDALVVGKVARLFELKGHEYLVQAAPAIVARFPQVRFLLVGDGNLRGELEAEIARLGLAEHFVFAGLVPPADVCRYTALMDVLVHLSLREGLPRTVVQGLASGVPAVGFPLDGTPEVILEGRTGLLCPTGDAAAVAAAVNALLGNPERRRAMGAAGRELVLERFSWQRMGDVLEAEYRRLLTAQRPT